MSNPPVSAKVIMCSRTIHSGYSGTADATPSGTDRYEMISFPGAQYISLVFSDDTNLTENDYIKVHDGT